MEDLAQDFYGRVDFTNTCWNWGSTMFANGYGFYRTLKTKLAHRTSYELCREDIPEGLVIDHLCDNRRCVNPEHLRVTTHAENIKRSPKWPGNRTHCINGHKFTSENTRITPEGWRECRKCRKLTKERYNARFTRIFKPAH